MALSSAEDHAPECALSKPPVDSMIEMVAAKHENEDDESGQHAVWICLLPCLHDGFTERPGPSVDMPCPLQEQHGSTDGAIEQRLVQRGHPHWMPGVESSSDGRHVEQHNNLREDKSEDYRRQEG